MKGGDPVPPPWEVLSVVDWGHRPRLRFHAPCEDVQEVLDILELERGTEVGISSPYTFVVLGDAEIVRKVRDRVEGLGTN